MYIFISEWKWYVVHISICFNKKIRPFIVIFDGLFETLYTGQGEGAWTKSKVSPGIAKVIHIASSLITILFSSTTLYYFENDARSV